MRGFLYINFKLFNFIKHKNYILHVAYYKTYYLNFINLLSLIILLKPNKMKTFLLLAAICCLATAQSYNCTEGCLDCNRTFPNSCYHCETGWNHISSKLGHESYTSLCVKQKNWTMEVDPLPYKSDCSVSHCRICSFGPPPPLGGYDNFNNSPG